MAHLRQKILAALSACALGVGAIVAGGSAVADGGGGGAIGGRGGYSSYIGRDTLHWRAYHSPGAKVDGAWGEEGAAWKQYLADTTWLYAGKELHLIGNESEKMVVKWLFDGSREDYEMCKNAQHVYSLVTDQDVRDGKAAKERQVFRHSAYSDHKLIRGWADVVWGDPYSQAFFASRTKGGPSDPWWRNGTRTYEIYNAAKPVLLCLWQRELMPPLPPPPPPTGDFTIEKKDGDTGSTAPIAGAVFSYSGPESGEITIGGNGRGTSPQIAPGTYTVTETRAPPGYRLDRTPRTVTVHGGKTSTLTSTPLTNSKYRTATVEIMKETAGPINGSVDGVVFTVTAKSLTVSDKNEPVWKTPGSSTRVTVTNGIASLPPLIDGSYEVREYSTPAGMQANSGVIHLDVANGQATITSNTTGAYAVRQSTAAWTALNSGVYPAPMLRCSEGLSVFCNAREYGVLRIVKADATAGVGLDGAVFEVSSPAFTGRYTTGAAGDVVSEPLPVGTYTVREVTPPRGYRSAAMAEQTVTVTAMSSIEDAIEVRFTNLAQTFDVQIAKQDVETGAQSRSGTFAKAKFEVTVVSLERPGIPGQPQPGEKLPGTFETDSAGLLTLTGLPLGEYQLREVSAPAGYVATSATVRVRGQYEVRSDGTIPEKSSLVEVTQSNAAAVADELTAVKERMTPGTPAVADPGTSVEAIGDGRTVPARFYNRAIYGKIAVEKRDATTGDLLDGAVYGIYRQSDGDTGGEGDSGGKRVGEIVTGDDGVGISGPLPYGSYVVKEERAPVPYLNDAPASGWVVTITEDGAVTALMDHPRTPRLAPAAVGNSVLAAAKNAGPAVRNTEQMMSFRVHKRNWISSLGDATLEGARFEVRVVSLIREGIRGQVQPGEVLGTFTTGADGTFAVTNVPLGTYEIREIAPPAGFALNPEPIRVTGEYHEEAGRLTDVIRWDYGANASALAAEVAREHGKLERVWAGVYCDGSLPCDGFAEAAHLTAPDTAPAAGPAEGANGVYLNKVLLGRLQFSKHFKDDDAAVGVQSGPEGGITFEILDSRQEVAARVVTAADGTGVSAFLPYGRYTVRQVTVPMSDGSRLPVGAKAPEGVWALSKPLADQVLDLTSPLIAADWTKMTAHFANEQNSMRVRIVKTDGDTGKPIAQAGVSFQIYRVGEQTPLVMQSHLPGSQKVDTLVTNEEGYTETFLKLAPGEYFIREVTGPAGYSFPRLNFHYFRVPDGVFDSDAVVVTVDLGVQGSENLVEADVVNKPQYGELEIHKVGEKQTGWSEATVNVRRQDPATISHRRVERPQSGVALTLVSTVANPAYRKYVDPLPFAWKTSAETVATDASGVFTRSGLGEGRYAVMYEGRELAHTVVDKGETGTITARLEPLTVNESYYIPGEVKQVDVPVKKPVYELTPLTGARFTLRATGPVMSMDGSTQIFAAGEEIRFATETIYAEEDIYDASGRHLLWKEGEAVYGKGDALSYPKIEGMRDKSTAFVWTVDGNARMKRLPLGTYTLTEAVAPSGWKLDTRERTYTFSPQASNVVVDLQATEPIENPRQVLSVELNKKVLAEHPYFSQRSVVNTLFGLSLAGETDLIAAANPGADGVVRFRDVPPGDYVIRELSTLNGYTLNEKEYTTSVAYDASGEDTTAVVAAEVENPVTQIQMVFAKVDADSGLPVHGALFELFTFDDDGTRIPVVNPETGVNAWASGTVYHLPEGHYEAI